MLKIPVGYDFTLARYAGKHELYFSVENCTVISDARASKKKMQRHVCFVKTVLFFYRRPIEVRLIWESSFRICNKISMCGEKCTVYQRISEYPFKFMF